MSNLTQRQRNLIVSLMFGFFAIMTYAAARLHIGAIAKDYYGAAYILIGVVILAIGIGLFALISDKDALDRLVMGVLLTAIAGSSLLAVIGTFTPLFATEVLAQTITTWTTTANAFLLGGIWFHTSFINDDFAI